MAKSSPSGCSPHGFYPASGCVQCSKERNARNRRKAGSKERQVGCTAHGIKHPCKQCQADAQRRRRARIGLTKCSHGVMVKSVCVQCNEEREAPALQRARLARQAEWEAEQLTKPDAAQRLMERAVRDNALGPDAQNALNELNTALLSTDPNCKDRFEFVDGTFTREEAAEMCAGCPVLELCAAYGKAAKGDYRRRSQRLVGIYGGKVVSDLR